MLDRPSPRYTHAAGWTPERIERLTKLWNEGLSATQIMERMGGGLTKNAVIGKAHRLKLSKRSLGGVSPSQNGKKRRRSNAEILADAKAPRQRSADPAKTGPGVGRYDRVDRNKLKSAAIRAEKTAGVGGLAFKINKARKDGLTPAEAMRAVFGRDDDPSFVDPDDGVDVTNLVGLTDLKSHDCRWPSGDPLTSHFGFCGRPAVDGKPYCDEHCARAYIGWRP